MRFLLPEGDAARDLQQEYEETGRCSIAPILSDENADELEAFLAQYDRWSRVRGFQGQRFDLPPGDAWRSIPGAVEDNERLERAIAADSGKRFAYRYDAISMVPAELDRLGPTPLQRLRAAFLAPATLAFLRSLSGEASIGEVEIQATRFGEGDFLSQHHDGPNVDRKVATVLGLSRDWVADWGGNLLFPSVDERLEGLSPGFNRLDLFGVPQFHLVSAVAPSAPRPRLAVSGWFVG
jgi:SM-20-related protein